MRLECYHGIVKHGFSTWNKTMKFIYGLAGDGRGHASMAIAIGQVLKAAGHDVKFVTGGESIELLQQFFSPQEIIEYPALRCVYSKKSLSVIPSTIKGLFFSFTTKKHILKIRQLIKQWEPDYAMTDFEPLISRALRKNITKKIPIISISPMNFFSACHIDKNLNFIEKFYSKVMAMICWYFCPKPDHVFVTKPFPSQLKPNKRHCILLSPIIRENILPISYIKNDDNKLILVYLRGRTESVLHVIEKYAELHNLPVKVYCTWQATSKNNVEFCTVDPEKFVEHMKISRLIITTAGNQLLSEIAYLGIPAIVIPEPGQIEQHLNAKLADSYLENCVMMTTKTFSLPELSENINKVISTQPQVSGNGAEEFIKYLEKIAAKGNTSVENKNIM